MPQEGEESVNFQLLNENKIKNLIKKGKFFENILHENNLPCPIMILGCT